MSKRNSKKDSQKVKQESRNKVLGLSENPREIETRDKNTESAPSSTTKSQPKGKQREGLDTLIGNIIGYINFALLVVLISLLLTRKSIGNETVVQEIAAETRPPDASNSTHTSTKDDFPSKRKLVGSFCNKEFDKNNLKGSMAVSKWLVKARDASRVCTEVLQYPSLSHIKDGTTGAARGLMSVCGNLDSVVVSGRSLDGKYCRILYKDVLCDNRLDHQDVSFSYNAMQQKTRMFFTGMCNGNSRSPYYAAVSLSGSLFNPEHARNIDRDHSFNHYTGIDALSVTMSTCDKNLPSSHYQLLRNYGTSEKQSSPVGTFNEKQETDEYGANRRVFSYKLDKMQLHDPVRMRLGLMISCNFNVSFENPHSNPTSAELEKSNTFPYFTAKAKYTHSLVTADNVKVTGFITLMFTDNDIPLMSFKLQDNDQIKIQPVLEEAQGEVEYLARPLISTRNGLVETVNMFQLKKEGLIPTFEDELVDFY